MAGTYLPPPWDSSSAGFSGFFRVLACPIFFFFFFCLTVFLFVLVTAQTCDKGCGGNGPMQQLLGT